MISDNVEPEKLGIGGRIERLENIIDEMSYKQRLTKKIYITEYTQRLLDAKIVGDETYDNVIARILG